MHINQQACAPPTNGFADHGHWQTERPGAGGHFDNRLDTLVDIGQQLILHRGVFHLGLHFASSQLVCWTFDNPWSYQVYNAEEVFSEGFMRLFAPLDSHLHTCIPRQQVGPVLNRLVSLRRRSDGSELRNASMHMLNGYITLGFACDDTRYIRFQDFIPSSNIGPR